MQSGYARLAIHAGGEYWTSMLAIRVGLNHNQLTGDTGLVLKIACYGFVIHYAFTSDEAADQPLHFFLLGWRF